MADDKEFDRLISRIEEAVRNHSPRVDNLLFNGGTILSILCASAASVVAGVQPLRDSYPWVVAALSAAAAVTIAVERSLGFGARWRFHLDMRNGYLAILDMIDFYALLPEAERPKYREAIWAGLYVLRTRESAIPNGGVPPPAPPTGGLPRELKPGDPAPTGTK